MSDTASSSSSTHQYQYGSWIQSRAPCPALNSLANHGFLPRSGTNITFPTLVSAIQQVYNLSLPLTLALVLPAFISYGKIRMRRTETWPHLPCPTYTLDLAALAAFGPHKIAHPASLVHADHPSFAPDPTLLRDLLSRARGNVSSSARSSPTTSPTEEKKMEFPPPVVTSTDAITNTTSISTTTEKPLNFHPLFKGLTINELAQIRVEREQAILPPQKMDALHTEIALGECGLMWLLMRAPNPESSSELHIPYSRLAQWLGEERLPDGWFEDIRPKKRVGLLAARKEAKKVGSLMKDMRVSGKKDC